MLTNITTNTDITVTELPVEHVVAAPVNDAEAIYWSNLADEVCGTSPTYAALLKGPNDEPQAY